MIDEGDEIIGVAGNKDDPIFDESDTINPDDVWLSNGSRTKRYLCTNCKHGKHSTPKKNICKGGNCECDCNSHYISKFSGKKVPYGKIEEEDLKKVLKKNSDEGYERTASDDFIDELNDKFNSRKK